MECGIIQIYFPQRMEERDDFMGMTMSQKILAHHAGLDRVEAGQLIECTPVLETHPHSMEAFEYRFSNFSFTFLFRDFFEEKSNSWP